MFGRTLTSLLLLLILGSTVVADPPPFEHPTAEWMTWTVYDAAEDEIDLQTYSGSNYVVVFSANDETSCKMMRDLAEHIRANPGKAADVLAMCIDDTGHKALKRHIRQEEWRIRVDEWEEDQDEARDAAELAGEEFVPEEMPDFLQEIKDELDDEDDLEDLMDHHFPFNAGCRCEAMWDWLSERMGSPGKAPRVMKFDSSGVETHEWTALPAALGG